MFLDDLIKKLGITDNMDKTVLAAIVYSTLESNKCGITGDNREKVITVITEGICDRFTFDVCELAASWCNDLAYLLCEHANISNPNDLFREHIWPFLKTHSPVDGVIME